MFSKIHALLKNPVAKNSFIMFIGMMVTNFGAYLYQLVVVRIFGPEKYSEFAALISLLFLLSVPANVLQIVLTKYFSIYKAREETGQARALFTKTLKLVIVSGFFGLPLFLLIIPVLQRLLHIYAIDSFVYLYIVVIGTFIVTAATAVLNGFQKFFASSVILSVLTFARLGTGIIFAPIGVAITILGNALAVLVSIFLYAFSLRFLFVKPQARITIKRSEIISFTVPTLLSTLGMTAFFNMDVVLVKHFFDAASAGIYASLTLFGKIIFFAASPIMIVIFPMIVERREQKKAYSSLFFFGFISVLILCLSIVIAYFISSEVITNLLFGDKFIGAAPYLGAYGMFMAFVTISNYLMTACLAAGKTKAGSIVFLGSCVQSIAIIFFHASLSQVISSISFVGGILICILLLYYRYGKSSV